MPFRTLPLLVLFTWFASVATAQNTISEPKANGTLEQASGFSQRTGRPLFVMAGQET